jgi:DNA-binding response OmpR family regulator
MSGERILIVEDERAVARGLEYGLAHEGFDVMWAETGQQALEMARSKNPHLILLDLRLPDISGYDVCRQLRAEGKRQPILMLTARDEELDKVLGLELGADDYVAKPFSPREVVARVRAVLRRVEGEVSPAAVIRVGDIVIDLARHTVEVAGQPVELTPTEFDLLAVLARYPGRVFTRLQLLDHTQGGAYEGYERTVDAHIKNLRQKIEPDPKKPRYILTIYGVGYKFSEEGTDA